MPAGNRMATSASLNTHSIWQNAIGYDPYAAESKGADVGANADVAESARENMKALLALANKNRGGDVEEKGGWKGSGKLRGGWAGGKDLGELPKEALPKGPRQATLPGDADDMPSSTSSFSDDDDEPPHGLASGSGGGTGGAVASFTDQRASSKKRSRDDDDREERRRREKKERKRERKEKKEKHGHKHRKEKKEKKHKHKKHKRSRHSSDSS